MGNKYVVFIMLLIISMPVAANSMSETFNGETTDSEWTIISGEPNFSEVNPGVDRTGKFLHLSSASASVGIRGGNDTIITGRIGIPQSPLSWSTAIRVLDEASAVLTIVSLGSGTNLRLYNNGGAYTNAAVFAVNTMYFFKLQLITDSGSGSVVRLWLSKDGDFEISPTVTSPVGTATTHPSSLVLVEANGADIYFDDLADSEQSFLPIQEDYYVDSDAVGDGKGYNRDNAFVSINSAVFGDTIGSIGPGDTVYFSGGATSKTYSITSPISPVSGRDNLPVSFKVDPQLGRNGVVILDGADSIDGTGAIFNIVNRKNITIDGEINGQRRLRLQNWGTGISGSTSFAINGYGTGSEITGVTIKYIDVVNDDVACASQDCVGMQLKGCVSMSVSGSSYVGYSNFDGCVRESINIGSAAGVYDDIVVEHNTIKGYKNTDSYGGPDGIKGLGSSTVRYNTIFHEFTENGEYNPSHPAEDGIQILGGYTKVYGNRIYGISQGAIRTDSYNLTNCHIFNNVIFATTNKLTQRGIELDGKNFYNVTVFNNTIVDFPVRGIHISMADGEHVDLSVQNNLMIGSNIIISSSGGDDSMLVIDYNLSLAQDLTSQGYIPVTQIHDPYSAELGFGFADYVQYAPSSDFMLLGSATMAINRGNSSIGVSTDVLGHTRDDYVDVGAYEYTPPGQARRLSLAGRPIKLAEPGP